MKKKVMFLCVIMAVISFISAIGTMLFSGDNIRKEEKITIVTSFYPVYIAAENIVDGADNVELINMTENHAGCLHDYQLTTNDMRKLENANIFIINGGGIELFTEDIIRAYPKLNVIDTSTGANIMTHGEMEENAHIWLSLKSYKIQIENILNGLIRYDNVNAKKYIENTKKYIKQVDMLIEEEQVIKKQIQNKNVIIFHEGFEYLAEELGLNVVFELDLDEEVSFSAGQIAEMIEKIHQYNVKAIFAEEEYKDLIAKSIKGETDALVYPLDALVSGENNKDSYLSKMRYNFDILKEAVK